MIRLNILFVLFIIFPLYHCGSSNYQAGNSGNNYSVGTDKNLNFITYYYLKPNPELISTAIFVLGYKKELDPLSVPPMVGFFNYVFHKEKEKRAKWTALINKQNKIVRSFLLYAMNTSPENMIESHDISPSYNDFCWGSYFASGDTRYLDILVSQLKNLDSLDIMIYFTASTAKWSLSSNAKQHPSVKKYLNQLIVNKVDNSKEIKDLLSKNSTQLQKETEQKTIDLVNLGVWNQLILNDFEEKNKQLILKYFNLEK